MFVACDVVCTGVDGVEVREWNADGYFSAPMHIPSFGSPPLASMNGGGSKKAGKKSPAYGGDYGYSSAAAATDIFATSKFDLSDGVPTTQLQQSNGYEYGYGSGSGSGSGGGGGGGSGSAKKNKKNKSGSIEIGEPKLSAKQLKKKRAAEAAIAAAKASGKHNKSQSYMSETIEGGKTTSQWADFCNSPAPQKIPLPAFLTERHPHFTTAHHTHTTHKHHSHSSNPSTPATAPASAAGIVPPTPISLDGGVPKSTRGSGGGGGSFSFDQFSSDLSRAPHSSNFPPLPSLPATAVSAPQPPNSARGAPSAQPQFASNTNFGSSFDNAGSGGGGSGVGSGAAGSGGDDCVFCWIYRHHRIPPPFMFASRMFDSHSSPYDLYGRSLPPYLDPAHCELCEIERSSSAHSNNSHSYAFPGMNRSASSPAVYAASALPPYTPTHAPSPRSRYVIPCSSRSSHSARVLHLSSFRALFDGCVTRL